MKFRRPRNYEEQTHENPWWLIRYPHQKRFATAATLLLADQPGVVVDYGAGNGEVLAQVLADPRGASIDLAIAYDPDPQMRASAEKKLVPHSPRAAVIGDLAELESALQGRRVDAVACLEVLEHLSLTERQRFYSVCSDNLVDGGLCLIDVPVEIGPTLLVKVFGRRVLKGRPREYRLGELLRPTFGMRVRDPERFDPERPDGWVQDHKGFDYRELRDELREWLPIEGTISTPVRALPPWLCNQEIFLVARQPSAPRPRDRHRSAAQLQRMGAGLPASVTGLGWTTSRLDWSMAPFRTTEARQAQYLTRTYDALIKARRALQIQRSSWHEWKDSDRCPVRDLATLDPSDSMTPGQPL